jgi:hypothetical protein
VSKARPLKWTGSRAAVAEHERAVKAHPPRRKGKQSRKKGKVKATPLPSVQQRRNFSYSEYLQSDWWRTRRKKALRRAGWKCERCGCRGRLEVHHLNYARLWGERDKDLQVLCRPCHELKHAAIIDMDEHLRAIASSAL